MLYIPVTFFTLHVSEISDYQVHESQMVRLANALYSGDLDSDTCKPIYIYC